MLTCKSKVNVKEWRCANIPSQVPSLSISILLTIAGLCFYFDDSISLLIKLLIFEWQYVTSLAIPELYSGEHRSVISFQPEKSMWSSTEQVK